MRYFNLNFPFFQMNQGFIQSPTRQVQQGWQHREHSGASRRGLTLDLPRSIWPSRVRIDLFLE